jgi:hypothetical protein
MPRHWKAVTLALCLLAFAGHSIALRGQGKALPVETYVKPREWRGFDIKLFKDSHDLLTFKLTTSWIPGEDHKGSFRYKLNATPNLVDHYDSPLRQFGVMIEHAEACSFTLVLMDIYGFELRRVPVAFSRVVNGDSDIIGLAANTSAQMDLSEYKSLIGSGEDSGRWNIAWSCPDN